MNVSPVLEPSFLPGYLTLAQAAEKLHRDHSTVARYVRNRLLPARRAGGQYFIEESAIENFEPPEPGNPLLKRK